MRGILTRFSTSDEGTKGELVIDGQFRCCTLELPWRDNKVRQSCIPTGTYKAEIIDSPKFGNVYLITPVEGRSGILIHTGNFAGDVKMNYRSDVEGCILVGMKFGELDGQMAVLQSRIARNHMMDYTKGESFQLIVEDAVAEDS